MIVDPSLVRAEAYSPLSPAEVDEILRTRLVPLLAKELFGMKTGLDHKKSWDHKRDRGTWTFFR